MKKCSVMVVFILWLATGIRSVAQGVENIPVHYVQLSEHKTTNLIFPYAVKSVDRGSGEVIAQVAQGFGNILQLKANVQDFKQTNVTVITSDGKFYSFLVDYTGDPKVLNLSFKPVDNEKENALALPDDYNDRVLDSDAARVFNARSFLDKKTGNEQMHLRLAGIYLKDGLMWFKLKISNRSQIAYVPDNIRFSVIDRKQVKRTARQENDLQQIYKGVPVMIKGKTSDELVLAFRPVTIPKTKHLKILIAEKTGGRNLLLIIKARKLLRARALKT